jgi:hypothetical protein
LDLIATSAPFLRGRYYAVVVCCLGFRCAFCVTDLLTSARFSLPDGNCMYQESEAPLIHVQFAALFCTAGLLCLAYEVFRSPARRVSNGFLFFYGSGTALWTVLGWMTGDSALVSVSLIQFFSVVLMAMVQVSRSRL